MSEKASVDSQRFELPSDFSPALLKKQAQLMGLNVDTMADEEIQKAVLVALSAQRPDSV